MSHKLKYKIGNPGDIIKHGLLAEFVAWLNYDEELKWDRRTNGEIQIHGLF